MFFLVGHSIALGDKLGHHWHCYERIAENEGTKGDTDGYYENDVFVYHLHYIYKFNYKKDYI